MFDPFADFGGLGGGAGGYGRAGGGNVSALRLDLYETEARPARREARRAAASSLCACSRRFSARIVAVCARLWR